MGETTIPEASSSTRKTQQGEIIPTSLESIEKDGFIFPSIWNFPPFFTLQPNLSTRSHQLDLWSSLVLSWARFRKVFMINVEVIDPGEVFINKDIDRRLQTTSLKTLMLHMTERNQAAPDPPKQTSVYLLYWRKPDEWGGIIYDWITENGMNNTILTWYELTDGDLAHTTEFYQLPLPMLRRALDTLVRKGKAQLLQGEGETGEGVRFL
ncbi:hypothetical protein M231_03568 [Tremella mesenterica]|uniref:ESCRT-II complex subunit VPS25 n=1 Tax=Tremella mesenterica TaxID=5217 RepID=A0A4Q1BMY4_TREME|nr:hypothetical protein M231_03568 [Tremella mesenterica]